VPSIVGDGPLTDFVSAMEDIDRVLAAEIKKDLAERYFGMRRIIEEDSTAYRNDIIASMIELESEVGVDLIRIYILLGDEDLIARFQDLTRIPHDIFNDPYVYRSPAIQKQLLNNQRIRGISQRRRFKNLILDLYQQLFEAIGSYRTKFAELTEQHDTIVEEINLFYRKNDFAGIMGFFRSLEGGDGTLLNAEQPLSRRHESMEGKMRLPIPDAVHEILPELPAIPPLREIQRQLVRLAQEAHTRQPHRIKEISTWRRS
jgi:hypothetical protein